YINIRNSVHPHSFHSSYVSQYFLSSRCLSLFFFNDPAPTEIYTLSLHDALPISRVHDRDAVVVEQRVERRLRVVVGVDDAAADRSEEHTSELQSRGHLVCRLLLEKKKRKNKTSRKSIYNLSSRRA